MVQGHSRPKPFSLPNLMHTQWLRPRSSSWRPGRPDRTGCPTRRGEALLDPTLPGNRDSGGLGKENRH